MHLESIILKHLFCFITSGVLVCLTIGSWGRSGGWFIAIVDLHVLNNSIVADFKWTIWHSWMDSGLWQDGMSWFQCTMVPPAMRPWRTNLSETQFHAQQRVSIHLRLWGHWAILNMTIQRNTKHGAWHTAVNNEYWPLPFKDSSRLKIQKASSRLCW